MNLLLALANARTEEDVKDAFIKALGLKGVFKGLAAQIASCLETHYVVYKIEAHEKEFIGAVNTAITNQPARLLDDGGKPAFLLNGQTCKLASERGYRNFRAIYHRPPEAKAVLDEGRKLWQRYHAIQFPRKVRDELKLNRPDAGAFKIRKALEHYGDSELTDCDPFKAGYATL